MESSSWGVTVLDLWDMAQGFSYPQVTMLHQYMGSGPSPQSVSSDTAGGVASLEQNKEPAGKPGFWIFEFGSHKALSNEPVAMLRHALPDFEVLHQNFVQPYEGRAEVFIHPFEQSCSPNCEYQQDSVPYIFPVVEDMEESRLGFRSFVLGQYLVKPEVRKASLFLCTNPMYYCNFFTEFNKTVLGYFGLPLHYMVPQEHWAKWTKDFVAMASQPKSFFVSNNPLHAEQVVWQTGRRIPLLRPVVLYRDEVYNPTRENDILLPEPRDACVLNCLIRAFTPEGYPLKFFGKADTDRTFQAFTSFRAVVLFPHDFALMTFYELYAMGVPIFMPSHMSKYLFPYSATVPLLDYVPSDVQQGCEGCEERAPYSPMNLNSGAALKHWVNKVDFFVLPEVQLFPSIAGLLDALPRADVHAISQRMRENRQSRLDDGLGFWRRVTESTFRDGLVELPRS
ncbi:unnamed protein product [Polarella glacialis]|uniref:Uncharacterized protein n=1 Tax=Polarella glacialis TaxID=89957 RepID=A0A813DPJ8_POLGL|nr:unnamed protein product [Polarella glacialis]